ncbi:hypothetical protein Skr01_57230 [Sphaerisporangium krabiense]|uniref:Uncharacterized protein n=1 Tax=Sphaerisporangium krabiense TaxID=763782 RepID=A0A7W8Z909_9ACTN|nr:hypothetical protein [Sphaerisporangium krabiense]MBB5629510.1 hypothetical protein [Sphaerisporangium krabiense]GII65638.1 hypothetical protein Skr01_57230 [Sphaerisporangium krabiense]
MTTDTTTRAEFIAGLRRLAAFLADNPKVPVPGHGSEINVFASGTDDDKRTQIDRIGSLIDRPVSEGTHYETCRDFGPITYRAVAVWDDVAREWRALMSYDGSVTA